MNAPYIPDVGDTFTVTTAWTYRKWRWTPFPWYSRRVVEDTSSYRVNSWMRQRDMTPPEPRAEEEALVQQILDDLLAEEGTERRWPGPDNVPLEYCYRDEAEYVSGYGVAGTIQRISDITVTGRVSWDEETIQEYRDRANALAGEPLR